MPSAHQVIQPEDIEKVSDGSYGDTEAIGAFRASKRFFDMLLSELSCEDCGDTLNRGDVVMFQRGEDKRLIDLTKTKCASCAKDELLPDG